MKTLCFIFVYHLTAGFTAHSSAAGIRIEGEGGKTGTWWPMFLWTDPMIRVHDFYCSLALLLRALAMMKARAAGLGLSQNKLHEELTGIREVINVFPKRKRRRPTQSVISKLGEVQKRLFDLFKMDRFLSS